MTVFTVIGYLVCCVWAWQIGLWLGWAWDVVPAMVRAWTPMSDVAVAIQAILSAHEELR